MASPVQLRDKRQAPQPRAAETPAGYRRWLHRRRLLLVVVALVAAAAGWVKSEHDRARVDAIVVVRPVPPGDRVTADDLGVGSIAVGRGVRYIPAKDRHLIVGKVASWGLAPGTLLARSQLLEGTSDAGRVQFPIAVKPGQFPPSVREGDKVIIVITPATSATTSNRGAPAGGDADDASIPATVRAVDRGRGSFGEGDVVITVSVPSEEVHRLAIAASDGRIVLAASS